MVLSPEISGGGGFTFEDVAVAIYLGALLGEEAAPGLTDRVVTRVAVQQAAFGEPLDDLIVDAIGRDGSAARLSLQVKRELAISAAASNTDFREIVTRAWATLAKSDFRENTDRVGTITGTVAEGPRRALHEVCEWARASLSVEAFLARFQRGGADDQHRGVLKTFQAILGGLPGTPDDANVLRVLRHFVLIKLDALHTGATDEVHAIERLRGHLHNSSPAEDLWDRLRVIAREAAGRATEFSRSSLLAALHGRFRLLGARSLRSDLERIEDETRNALATIGNQIDGVDIARPSLVAKTQAALKSHRFVHIIGPPGTGKSAVLRAYAESELRNGTVLLLKSDRLSGRYWAAYAQSLGLDFANVDTLLTEIAASGSSVLFIDGIDRIEVPNRGVVLDLLNAILRSPAPGGWRIIASARESGIEPLRTWFPRELFGGAGVGSVDVGPFDDEESEALARRKPALRRLLFGEKRVRDIARRPFFAAVLARATRSGSSQEAAAPTSEVELIDVWWSHGGYNSDQTRVYHRQRTLIKLAKAGAPALGRRIGLNGFDLDAVRELKEDEIIRDVVAGHAVQFAHDIFFEWSFLHLLIEHETDWIEQIRSVGEPPVLGRTVELLSQAGYPAFENWQDNLRRLEATPVRPQWTRAWLTAPFGSPRFWENAEQFTAAMLGDDAKHLAQLAVWFQAEKTQANPLILGRSMLPQTLSPREVVRYADALAWPSDLGSWSRFLQWILRNIESCPVTILADIVSGFEVWQNMLADRANGISAAIIGVVNGWLEDIEDREHAEEFRFDHGRWGPLSRGERSELEDRLRNLLLRSARIEIERVRGYLRRVQNRARLRDEVFGKVIAWTPTLASTHARDMVNLCLAALIDELPADVAKRPDAMGLSHSVSVTDWNELAIRDTGGDFSPASPLREPLASLFPAAPAQAQELVRKITNHAVTAWRELHDLNRRQEGTPIPLELEFPWGRQEFWGDGQVYMWARGQWAPPPVLCGLMALEKWAFGEVERGRVVDEVIQEVVSGHESCAVLNIAVALALESNRVSRVTLPLAISQRIWHWDIGRYVTDLGGVTNLIGFIKPSDLPHAEAVRSANGRRARRIEVRWLAQLFVLNSDESLRSAAQTAILAFPEALPFELEEEKQDGGRVADLRRTAEIWAEVGRIENYSATPAPDGRGTLIALENPRSSEPDIVATAQRSERMNEQMGLLNWIYDSFERRTVSEKRPLQQALDQAHRLDRDDLFTAAHGEDHTVDMDQSLVAGVAAIAVLYAEELDSKELQWSKGVMLRAWQTPEHHGELWSSRSMPLQHPCLYSARGLPGLIRRGLDIPKVQVALLTLAGHPLEKVSETALASALALWDIDANFAWIALNLAIRLSVGSRDRIVSAYGYDHATAPDQMAATVDVALRELSSGNTFSTLQRIPPAWVFAAPKPRDDGLRFGGNASEPIWREPDEFLRWDFLPKIFGSIPIGAVMADALRRPAFLSFCDDLLNWTLERMNPSWRSEKAKRRERQGTELLEWRRSLLGFLAHVALRLEPDDVQRRFLDRIFALENEAAESLIHPFVDVITAAGIFDAPQIAPNATTLVMACLERTLKDHVWARARNDEGDLFGYDVPPLVKLYLFVSIEFAGGAARFANRDWREVAAILPIVDRFVREVGDVPDVMSAFLTLCERAVEHYPVAAFVDQVTAAINRQERTPVGWRNSTLPGRIAGLIHAFAEREQPLARQSAQAMLRVLDRLVDMGDRRSAALQMSETFKDVRL